MKKLNTLFRNPGIRKTLLVMRITFVLLIVGLVRVSASVYSQNTMLEMNLENAAMEEILDVIKEQSEFNFLYRSDIFDDMEGMTVDFTDVQLETVLETLLVPEGFEYEIEDNVVVIRKTVEEVAVPQVKVDKKVKLTGVVKDEDGNTVPFAAVMIKGTTIGTATDINGNFEFELEPGEYESIIASSIGFISHEILMGNNTNFEFILRTDVSGLSEVIVTGYQTISKERATGSFDKISRDQIDKPSSSISERLIGSLAGVQSTVNADGSIDFEIRGKSSLLANAQPLIVVDGFPIIQENQQNQWGQSILKVDAFSSINPNDIESVTVLKDAAAGSIWGAKAANGVIVITTKKGRRGKAKVEFSSFMKVSPMLDLDYVNPRASSAETIEYEKLGYNSGFFGSPFFAPSYAPNYASSAQSQAYNAMFSHQNGLISEAEMNSELARLSTLDNRDQIADELMRNPFTQQYNLSVTGGNQVMTNSLSILYENNKDNFKENNTDKFIVNFRNKVEITKWLDFDFAGMMRYNDRTNNGSELYNSYGQFSPEFGRLQPYDMLRDENGNLTNLNNMFYLRPVLDNMVPTGAFPYSDWSYNPISALNERDFNTTELNSRIQTGLTFKILKGLTVNSKILYELMTRDVKDVYKENSFVMRRMINETSTWDGGTGVTQNMPFGGALQQNSTQIQNFNFRNQLNFVRTFNEKHAINFVAGSEITSKVIEMKTEPDVFGYNDDKLTVGRMLTPLSQGSMWNGYPLTYARYFYPINLDPVHTFTHLTDRYFSVYGNMAYTYNDKYTVTGSLRTDASNLITDDPKYRYSPFWSTGFGWQLGKEDFLKDTDWIDRLNVRGTFGYSGNVDRSTSFLPLLNISGTANLYTNETTASIGSYGNPTLRWEKTQSINFGLDYSLFNSRLFGTLDVYQKHGSDLIVNQSIPAIHGTTTQKFNNGEMVNKGIELTIGTSLPLKGNDIKWYGNLNFAYNKNEITSFFKATYQQSELVDGGTGAYSEGYDANTFWSFEYAGMQNIGTEADPKMAPAVQGVGDATYPLTTWAPGTDHREFMTAQGTKVAPYILGFQNSFKIYDFDLSFIFTGKFGHVYRRHGFNYPSMAGGNSNVNDMYDEVANGDPNEIIPIPGAEARYYFYDRYYPYMSYLTESASHIRFQELNLTYNIPSHLSSKIGLQRVRVYAQGNNLGTIVFNGYGEDPEYPIGTLKPQATFTFGLKISL